MDINKICPSGKCLTGDKCARGSISFMGYSGTVGFCNVTDSIIDQITKATGVSNLGVCDGTNSQKPGICTCSSTSCNPKPTDLSFLSTKSNSFGNPTFYQQKSNGTCSKLSYRLFLLALVLSLFKLHKWGLIKKQKFRVFEILFWMKKSLSIIQLIRAALSINKRNIEWSWMRSL